MSPPNQATASKRTKKLKAADVTQMQNEIIARLQDLPNPTFAVRREWVLEYGKQLGDDWTNWAWSLINILVAKYQPGAVTNFTAKSVVATMNQSPQTTSVTQTAGGNQIGNTAGIGNMTEIGTIISFSEWVDRQSDSTNTELGQALKDARAELESVVTDREEQEAVLHEYQKLAEEVLKKDKKTTTVKMAWGAINAIISAAECLPSLTKLGQLLHLIPKEKV